MSLAKKSFSLLQRDIFLFITNTITSIAIARTLGPEIMGLWVILSLVTIYAETFGRLKLEVASVYYLGQGKYSEKDAERTLNSVALLVSIIICLPTLIWSKELCSYLFEGSLSNLFYLRVILLQVPFSFLYMNYSYLLIYKENTSIYNRMTIIKALASSLGALLLIYVFNLGLGGVVYSSIASVLFGSIYGFFNSKILPEKGLGLINISLLKDFANYGSKLYVAGIVGNLNVYAIRTILAIYLSPASLAFYSIAQDRATLLNKIPESLNILLFSRISKLQDEREKSALAARGLRIVGFVMLIAGLASLFVIEPLVKILYGEEFLPMVIPFKILIPGILALGGISILIQFFNGVGKISIQIWIYSIILGIQVVLSFLLIEKYGVNGASVVFSLSMILAFILSVFVFLNISGINIRSLIFTKKDFQFLLDFFGNYWPKKLRFGEKN